MPQLGANFCVNFAVECHVLFEHRGHFSAQFYVFNENFFYVCGVVKYLDDLVQYVIEHLIADFDTFGLGDLCADAAELVHRTPCALEKLLGAVVYVALRRQVTPKHCLDVGLYLFR